MAFNQEEPDDAKKRMVTYSIRQRNYAMKKDIIQLTTLRAKTFLVSLHQKFLAEESNA